MLKNKINVLFICPYPIGQSPSQRFRFEQYFDLLQTNAFSFGVHPFLSLPTWQVLYKSDNSLRKIFGVLGGFIRRFWLVLFVGKYDIVFIHREATPFGPPWFEWIVAKVFKKRIIYDFDDAIWLTDKTSESSFERTIRCRKKFGTICKLSYKVSCGNQYLLDYTRKFTTSARLNPTTIDLVTQQNQRNTGASNSQTIYIGWTGSHSTLKYLKQLESVLQQIEKSYPLIKILVIADKKPNLNIGNLEFVRWNLKTEIEDLSNISIGIMPLPDNDWTRGKCGFKILQYMSLGIPSVASPVGVNKQIIKDKINGFLCETEEEWCSALENLIINQELRNVIGQKGKQTLHEQYSTQSNAANFLALFEEE